MYELKQGQNLGRVLAMAVHLQHAESFLTEKLQNLKCKTRPKQLLGSLPLNCVLPGLL